MEALRGGSFYGSILRRQEQQDAIFTDLRHTSARKLPAHSHELPFFALLLEGDYHERYGRQQTQFGPCTISYRPAGITHQDEVGPRGVRFFEIEIRPGWRKRVQDCSGTLDTAYDDLAGGHLLWLGMKLYRETRCTVESGNLAVESLLAEMLATVAGMPREFSRDSPSWMKRIVDKLNTEFCRRLTLDELGKEAGVHPVHLSRVFRKCVGEGIGEFVHRLRVQEACRQMLQPEMSLADIAASIGFADQSHLTRIFRRITGMSPGAFRQMVKAA